MATIRDKVGHLETLPIDLLYAHLDVSFIFNHLDAMNGSFYRLRNNDTLKQTNPKGGAYL